MAEKIKVALSPFYRNPEGFKDEVSGILFQHGKHGEVIPHDITRVQKLEGIKRALRLNVLLLTEGKLDSAVEEVKVEEVKAEEPKVEAPAEEAVEEAPKHKHHSKKKA